MINPLDVKALTDAMHVVLRKKGIEALVPESEVQQMARYLLESLEYSRAHRLPPEPPAVPNIKPSG